MTAQTGAGRSNQMPPICVTVEQATHLLGVSKSTVWSLIKAGRIKVARIGRRTLPTYVSLEALAEPEISEGISKAAPNTTASVERLK
jgi:excisionase family DNA binding protein